MTSNRHPAAPIPDERRLVIGLAGLTALTGLVDATSYLGLGHVFTANMTGNVVFLGFAAGGAAGFSVPASLLALGGFLAGALVGGRLVPSVDYRRAVVTFGIETLLLAIVAILAASIGDPNAGAVRWALVTLLGASMGLQNSAVRRLAVGDMTTTVLTLTMTGLAADSRLAGGSNPRVARRFTSVVLMFTGAAVGAALESHALWWPAAAAAVISMAATVWLAAAPGPS